MMIDLQNRSKTREKENTFKGGIGKLTRLKREDVHVRLGIKPGVLGIKRGTFSRSTLKGANFLRSLFLGYLTRVGINKGD